jgi:hypothetical protein
MASVKQTFAEPRAHRAACLPVVLIDQNLTMTCRTAV